MTDGCCDETAVVSLCSTPAARELAARGFAALWRGDQPLVAELGDPAAVTALSGAGRLEVDRDGRLVGIHGLVMRPTRHRIDHAGGTVHTWCALDAIGIPAALGIDATAVTSCPACGAQLRVVVTGGVPATGGELRLRIPTGACDHLVEDFCPHANLFCDDAHLRSYWSPGPGRAVTVAEAAAMGRAMWHDVAGSAPHRE